jgi:hypothetical protein
VIVASVAALTGCGPPGVAGDSGDRGLALLYSFDARSGTVVQDLSGNGHHGTAFGATWADGRFGGALAFDGVDDYVQSVGYFPFGDANGLTVEAWLKLDRNRLFSTIVASRNCCVFRLLISPGMHPYYDPGIYADVEGTPYTFQLGQWTHVAFVVLGGRTARILIDGRVVWESPVGVPGALPSIYDAMFIGGVPNNPFFMEGLIDEFRIYKRALSDDEIRTDMNSSTTWLVVSRAESLVSRVRRLGLRSSAEQTLQDSRSAWAHGDEQVAQNLAYRAASLTRQELARHGSSGGITGDAGRVLVTTLMSIFVLGTLVAIVLVWSAWKTTGAE